LRFEFEWLQAKEIANFLTVCFPAKILSKIG
jgi:hypothetical protein